MIKLNLFFYLLILIEMGIVGMFFLSNSKEQKKILAIAFILAGLELIYLALIIYFLR